MEFPFVLGMKKIDRRDGFPPGRFYTLNGVQFRLYAIRGLKSHKGAWYLKKLRNVKFRKYVGSVVNYDAKDQFIKDTMDWGERYAEEQGWIFVPEATHLMRSTDLPDSCQVMIEIEVLAQRGE